MQRGYVVGLDLSLRAPAVVAIPVPWRPGDWKRVKFRLGKPPEPESVDDVVGHLKRYVHIVKWVDDFLSDIGVTSVRGLFIEAYGFSKNNAQSSRLQESGGAVKTNLYRKWGIVARSVPSSTARKYLLGFNPNKTTGHDAKQVVLHTLYKRLKSPTWGEDVSDAFVVANYGYGVLGLTGIALDVRKTAPKLVDSSKPKRQGPTYAQASRRSSGSLRVPRRGGKAPSLAARRASRKARQGPSGDNRRVRASSAARG